MACYDFKLIISFNCSVSAIGIIQYPMIWEDHHIYQHEALVNCGHDLVLCIHLYQLRKTRKTSVRVRS
jgi:hypothetical protein